MYADFDGSPTDVEEVQLFMDKMRKSLYFKYRHDVLGDLDKLRRIQDGLCNPEQLKELLLVSRVAIGVRVEIEEHQDEESTSFEREAVQESLKRNKDDSIC